MGTPPAPNYATLYFAIHEINIVRKYPELGYYSRYIDDGLGVWTPKTADIDRDKNRWEQFQTDINSYGNCHPFFTDNGAHKPLQWEFSNRGKKVQFLDLTITLQGTWFLTTIYERNR